MRGRSARRWVLGVVSVVLLAAGCSAGGPSGPGAPTARPTATATPIPIASTPAVATAPIATPSPPSAGPPAATLAVEGGDPVVGQLGSFTWGDGGSDSPWLPGAPIVVGAGEELTVVVADGVPLGGWVARRVVKGSTNGAGAIGIGEGGAGITFPAPPSGSWSIHVDVRFAGDLGSAAYYWQVTVR